MSRKTIAALLGVLILCGLLASAGLAQTGSGFDLSWNVMGGGGAGDPLTGSGFSVRSTIGQTAVGSSSYGAFDLGHGYWLPYLRIYLPLVLRAYHH